MLFLTPCQHSIVMVAKQTNHIKYLQYISLEMCWKVHERGRKGAEGHE